MASRALARVELFHEPGVDRPRELGVARLVGRDHREQAPHRRVGRVTALGGRRGVLAVHRGGRGSGKDRPRQPGFSVRAAAAGRRRPRGHLDAVVEQSPRAGRARWRP